MHKTILILVIIFLTPVFVAAVRDEDYTHLNITKIKKGCNACHAGSRAKGPSMLRERAEELCFRCHGPKGRIEERAQSDIFVRLIKKSNHPVLETSKYHVFNEQLPERDPSVPRHVSCLDCHKVHLTKPGKTLAGIKGISISGRKKKAEKESEVCYNCHSDSINLPPESSDLRIKFDPVNASYHPIERVSKSRSRSLKTVKQGDTMKCTNCHEPHGSDYVPLLKKNYNLEDGSESQYAYELCYSCHSRNDILANNSFKGGLSKDYGHKEHIVYQKTSCYTCHASHGSEMNTNLIEFNPSVVTGAMQYLDYQSGRAQCNLTCHDKEHK